ncbi:MAG: S8 family serine peptidase [Verrucomicrobia bacterium]|nr:S8 family serine peptidase [Verrucomicrobiota bacterium]
MEFGTRVRQRDNAAVDATGHATAVAGTMAAGGVGSIFGQFYEARGVAYQARVFAYDLGNFKSERESAAAGDATNAPVFLGNHSWGLANGWRRHQTITNQFGAVVTNAWVWWGPPEASFPEDPKFGLYTRTNIQDTGCVQIDQFHYAEALRHLMVYSCGNDRFEGPGTSPGTYYWLSNGVFVASTVTRDWQDGDDGGYDSLSAPGNAKNVLTVGACEDVFWISNTFLYFGIGPGANAVPAPFSGAGPTDDGQLKPDLVAVGTPNLWLRDLMGQVSGTNILGLISPTVVATNLGATNFYAVTARCTSFAAPGVVGGLGLVLQGRAQLYPLLTNATDAWLNSTLKAVAIDTVDDVGAEGPDYRLGHGIFNARRAVERVEQDYTWGRGSLIREFTLSPTQSVSWVVTASGTKPLSVTVAWSDPPGPAITNVAAADMPNPMLVNNLDVVVERLSDSTLFRPWVLNPDLTNKMANARSAAATRGVDNRNNVERVSIATPSAGEYRITVTHSGGLPGNPAPSMQKVSVVSGGVTPPAPVITALEKSPSTNEFLLTFVADPGAYFTILTSTNVATPLSNWTSAVSALAQSVTNTVVLTSSAEHRFWALRRGQ